MKILAVGDIVGESGLKKAKEIIPNLKREKQTRKDVTKPKKTK